MNTIKVEICCGTACYLLGAAKMMNIEDQLSEEILSGRIKQGDTVTAGYRRGKVVFDVK